jgi:NAD(P)-dependent dehydrogenase (short-subunit alcohol dehydrogenase family)
MGRLTGKAALVTGSTSGLRRSMADAFAAEGANVVVTGRNKAAGERAVAELRAAGGHADYIRSDLSEGPEEALRLAERATQALGGKVDVLVNNAGLIPVGATADTDETTYDDVWSVNVKAAYFLTGALAPSMVARGGGAVINIGSINASYGGADTALYGATKAALHSLTRSWAAEYGPGGVRACFTNLCERMGKLPPGAPGGMHLSRAGRGAHWRTAAATATRWPAASCPRPRRVARRSACRGRPAGAAGR